MPEPFVPQGKLKPVCRQAGSDPLKRNRERRAVYWAGTNPRLTAMRSWRDGLRH
jgi:hypothetical protein